MGFPFESIKDMTFIYRCKNLLTNYVFQRDSTYLQLSKFGLVGILNTLVGFGAFFLFINYTNYIIALIISHIIGVTHSYIWNRYWIFKSEKVILNEFIKFNSVYAAVFLTNALVLIFFVNVLKWDPRIVQLIALPIITVISFTGQKYWSFRQL
jgi:putative flippase GtrA